MSIERMLRRITKNLAKAGHINAEDERTMVMVSVGAKGYNNQWPCRPFHQKPGSMRRKKAIRNFLHSQPQTIVNVFTGVTPVSAGPMFISADGVDQEINFDYAAAVVNQSPQLAAAIATVQAGINDLHEAGVITEREKNNFSETMRISRGVNDPNPIETRNGVPVEPHVTDVVKTIGEAKYAINLVPPKVPFPDSPLEQFIAVDPGTPGYPDRAVAAQFTRDPATGAVTLVSTSIVAPPVRPVDGEGIFAFEESGQPVKQFMDNWTKQAQAAAGAGKLDPDVAREYQNTWTVEGDLNAEPADTANTDEALNDTMASRKAMLDEFKADQAALTATTVDGKPDQVYVPPVDPLENLKAQILAEADQTLQGLLLGLNLVSVGTVSELPDVGEATKSYYVAELGALFRWDTDCYIVIEHKGVAMNALIDRAFGADAEGVKQELATPGDGQSLGRRLWNKLVSKFRK